MAAHAPTMSPPCGVFRIRRVNIRKIRHLSNTRRYNNANTTYDPNSTRRSRTEAGPSLSEMLHINLLNKRVLRRFPLYRHRFPRSCKQLEVPMHVMLRSASELRNQSITVYFQLPRSLGIHPGTGHFAKLLKALTLTRESSYEDTHPHIV